MHPKIRIALANGHELFRRSIYYLLLRNESLEIVGEAETGREIIDLLKNKVTNIVLLDTDISIIDGKTTLSIIQKRFPDVKVIMLSVSSGVDQASEYMARGACAYLGRECNSEKLLTSILTVYKEGYYFDECISKELLSALVKEKTVQANMDNVFFNQREVDVAREICDGKTNKEIASKLHLSPSTIDFYKTRLYGKAKCKNAVGLYKFLLKVGLFEIT